jgi:hypothetical protein
MRYFVHKPCPPLDAVVDYLWSLSDTPRHAHERIVPSGTFEMVVDVSGASESDRRFPGAVVSGCFSGSFDIDTRVHAGLVGVHFRPGGAARLLGVQAGEIANRHVDLEDLWGRRASELRERLCVARDPRERFMILERTLVSGLQGIPTERGAVKVALAELDRPGVDVGQVAEKVGLSRRRLIEIFTQDVGLIVIAYAVLHLTMFTGDFGTGSGRAGAIVAIVMGLTSVVLAGITLRQNARGFV